MNWLLVMLGGALGSGARYGLGLALGGGRFPWGTFAVNLGGGLAMGLVIGGLARVAGSEPWRLLLGIGFLGGFTTFSSFALDAVTLVERGAPGLAALYVLGSVAGAIGGVAAGLALARGLA